MEMHMLPLKTTVLKTPKDAPEAPTITQPALIQDLLKSRTWVWFTTDEDPADAVKAYFKKFGQHAQHITVHEKHLKLGPAPERQ